MMRRLFLSLVLALALAPLAAQAALERQAFTITRWELDVSVNPRAQSLRASGKLTLRNDSKAPQRHLSLQISSSLAWSSVRADGKPAQYLAERYTTDIDHTGAVSEAVVTLARDVAPGGTVELEVAYGGVVARDATRLTRIGAPATLARRNDWDQIAADFTAVRGIGYVCWYPVALDAVSLSNGSEVFDALSAWKQRHAASSMTVRLTVMADRAGIVPEANEHDDSSASGSGGGVGGVAGDGKGKAEFSSGRAFRFSPLDLAVPTFVAGEYKLTQQQKISVFHLPEHESAARDYAAVALAVQPVIGEWFGPMKRPLTIIELPESDVLPFDSGTFLFTPLATADRTTLELVLAHHLTHASFDSPRPWIYEGLAHFAQALQREKQKGRTAALNFMRARQPALVEAERQLAATSANASDASLVASDDQVLLSTKAMSVWWMLRDMLGDAALRRALARYRTADDREPAYLQRLLESEAKKPLEWFFDDWVYRDRGLPDFRIEAAYPRPTIAGSYGVTVTIENTGGAAAEVPVLVHAGTGERSGERVERVQVPAHGKAVARVLVPAVPTQAEVNDGSVPESDFSNNRLAIKVEKPPEP